ncbi:histidine kinase [Streptomyces sp. NPDC002506]|uniref:sensor histidine kinase n=1 Tax=Streptomyces sp. NPDC002506 TaxID=3154536 RepID=UPI00332D051E
MPTHICTLAQRRLRSLLCCDTPSPRRLRLLDTALALLVGAASCLALTAVHGTGIFPGYAASCLCALVAAASLMWRRTRPALCVLVAFAATLCSDEGTALTAATYAVGRYGTRRRATVVGAAVLAWLSTRWLTGELIDSAPWRIYFTGLAYVLPAACGHFVRRRRAYEERLRAQVARAEAAGDQAARFALSERGTLLAHEIHDNVGHHTTCLVLRAGAAGRRAGLPAEVAKDFEELQKSALTVMRGLRDVIDTLRAPGEADHRLRPTDCHDFLADLTQNMRAIGMDVTYSVTGTPRPCGSPGDDLLYRTGREALTNAAKYAPGAPVHIDLAFAPGTVALTVHNGPTSHRPVALGSGGLGLAGLRRAVTAAGGRFHAGRRPDGGFRVRAVLPLPHSEESEEKEPAP